MPHCPVTNPPCDIFEAFGEIYQVSMKCKNFLNFEKQFFSRLRFRYLRSDVIKRRKYEAPMISIHWLLVEDFFKCSKGRDIFKSGYPVGGFFKGSEFFSVKFKGYENFLKNCKGYENFQENSKGYENFPENCKGYEIF